MLLYSRPTVVRRASVVRPWNPFSQNLSSRLMPNLAERYLFTVSPDHFFFFAFQSFAFWCFTIRFFFFNMGPDGRRNFKWHLLWKYIIDSLQNFMHTCKEGLYQSCIKIGKISNFGFSQFFSFSLTWNHVGEKNFKRHLVWKYTRDLRPKNQAYSQIGTLSKLYKDLWNFKIWIFGIFFVLFLGRLTRESRAEL